MNGACRAKRCYTHGCERGILSDYTLTVAAFCFMIALDNTGIFKRKEASFMDNRPIGFFDSGPGGLTCIPYLMDALPRERIVYFGDTAGTPYGSKAVSTIRAFSFEISDFLIENDVKMIVIACNTVSSVCIEELRKRHPKTPFLSVIDPAARATAELCGPEDRIGVVGTKATIRSNAYRNKILNCNRELDIAQAACPALVPLIEEGIIEHEIMDLSIRYYLDGFISYNNIDTLVLGCTHYPLIRRNIQKLYPGLRIVDPSREILQSIRETLTREDMLAATANAEHTFYASDLSENFVNMIRRIFESTNLNIVFKTVDTDTLRRGLKGERDGN
ncbi:MAG: glutamate racemase [Clostridiales Family XIII bacterium]|jgi:glutamate racemase|nr:glutamate racemase [Clostridiales Family XIII bacterium]